MRTIELFCGTKSFSKVMTSNGHSTFTIDNDPIHSPDICISIMDHIPEGEYDILWASPPCQGFSVAAIGKNWDNATKLPKSDSARLGLMLLERTIELISIIHPRHWFIENPRGMMRKKIDQIFSQYGIHDYHRTTVTYCQYGDTRMKPTDIWTNLPGWFGKKCANLSPCHDRAPRGSRRGTQGIKGAIDRGAIPPALFEEILSHITKVEASA